MGFEWRYGVLLACFVINALEMGTFKSFGVFLLPVKESLQTDDMTLGSWMAACQALAYIFAPAFTLAASKIGERRTIICGGILCSVALMIMSSAKVFLPFGVCLSLAGFGYGMAYMPTILAISHHFKSSNLNTAIGVMNTGGAVGMMIFPPIVEFLIEIYGWRGALLILGGINANLILCGTIIHPVRDKFISDELLPISKKIAVRTDEELTKTSFITMITTVRQAFKSISNYIWTDICVFYNVPSAIPLLFHEILIGACFTGWAIFLVPNAILKGFPTKKAVYLSSIGGVGSLVGRICPGPIMDKRLIMPIYFGTFIFLVNAVVYFVDPLISSFRILALLAFLNGFCNGTQAVVFFGICRENIPKDHATDAFAFALILYGTGEWIGGLLLGFLLDNESTQSKSFLILGGLSLCAALTLVISIMMRGTSRKGKN